MRVVWLLVSVAGAALPLVHFLPWLFIHGPDVPLLVQEAAATPVSAFAWSDVLVAGLTVAIFVVSERRRIGMRFPWLPVLGLAVGPSLALPLFLYLRERHIDAAGSDAPRQARRER